VRLCCRSLSLQHLLSRAITASAPSSPYNPNVKFLTQLTGSGAGPVEKNPLGLSVIGVEHAPVYLY